MGRIRLPLYSRYKDTQILRDKAGRTYFGLFQVPVEIQAAIGNLQRVKSITEGEIGRLDIIAYSKVGGTEAAWWTIAYVNGMIDPVEDMDPDYPLQLPASREVKDFLVRRGSA